MPHKPKRASEPELDHHVVLRVPGWFKNQIIDLAAARGVSVNQWILAALRAAVLAQQDIPEPPQARAPLPTTVDQIRAYAEGERLTLPCGKVGTECAGTTSAQRLGAHQYCPECNIRVA